MSSQLEVIIKESGLENTKAKYILENFQSYFQIAAEWEAKAKALIVTSPFQTAEMEQAREGRLFLREKRLAIENSRKKLKEDALREGKAIDGIANVLKALIVPIEEYLDAQEHFVEIENKKKEDAHRAEVEKRMADEEAQRQRDEAEKADILRLENERLKKEASERDKKAAEEKKKQDDIIAKERAKTQAAKDKANAEIKKADEEKRKAADAAKKKLDAERKENERLEELLRRQVECPKCHHKFEPKVK